MAEVYRDPQWVHSGCLEPHKMTPAAESIGKSVWRQQVLLLPWNGIWKQIGSLTLHLFCFGFQNWPCRSVQLWMIWRKSIFSIFLLLFGFWQKPKHLRLFRAKVHRRDAILGKVSSCDLQDFHVCEINVTSYASELILRSVWFHSIPTCCPFSWKPRYFHKYTWNNLKLLLILEQANTFIM